MGKQPRQNRPLNKPTRIFCAVCLGFLPFVLIEFALRMTGMGTPTGYQDPFVGFSQAFPLFELNSEEDQFATSRHHRYFFGRHRKRIQHSHQHR